jgi:hypothetical protein
LSDALLIKLIFPTAQDPDRLTETGTSAPLACLRLDAHAYQSQLHQIIGFSSDGDRIVA